MSQDVGNVRVHQTFSGASTQTIAMTSSYSANVVYLDIYVAAATTIDVKVGAYQVAKGTIAAEQSPAQLRFGSGVGSGGFGDDITVTMGDAAEVFMGYVKYKKSN